MAVTPDEFRSALSRLPSGVTIVTSTDASGTPHGVTVSAFMSLSLNPPLVAVGLRPQSRTTGAIGHRKAFVVHLLAAGNVSLARRFSIDGIDKFEGVAYTFAQSGLPLLHECSLRLECSVEAEHPGGDHLLVIGRVQQATPVDAFDPLLYHQRLFRRVGDALTAV